MGKTFHIHKQLATKHGWSVTELRMHGGLVVFFKHPSDRERAFRLAVYSDVGDMEAAFIRADRLTIDASELSLVLEQKPLASSAAALLAR